MTTGVAIILGVVILVVLAVILWLGIYHAKHGHAHDPGQPAADANKDKDNTERAEEDVNHLFNKDFREELRNRGRLRFENIIDENAMFLKQDLDMTIAQLNEYIKKEIGNKLNEEFAAYTKAMQDAQELAMSALQKSANSVEENRQAMAAALQQDVATREAALVKTYEENMAKIIEHYLLATLGQQFDLKSQLPYIISQMEANKAGMLEDMRL